MYLLTLHRLLGSGCEGSGGTDKGKDGSKAEFHFDIFSLFIRLSLMWSILCFVDEKRVSCC